MVELNGYLAVIPSADGATLKGELYKVEGVSTVDDYEGVSYPYERLRVGTSCEGGTSGLDVHIKDV